MPLILRKIDLDNCPGKWFDRVLFGQTVRFRIPPKPEEVTRKIRDRFKKTEGSFETYDEKGYADAVYDHFLQDFEGFCDESGTPIPATLENKKAIIFMDVPPGEMGNWTFILGKAIEQGVGIYEAEKRD